MTGDFRPLREIPAPDLWPKIERELEWASAPLRARRAVGKLAVVLGALAIAGVGIGVAVRAFLGGTEPTPATPASQPVIVARLPIAARDVAIGEGAVWSVGLLERSGEQQGVFRIDPITNRVIATIPIAEQQDLTDIAAGAGAVWVLDPGPGKVIRIDPATNRIVATVAVGGGYHPSGLAVSDDALYVELSATGHAVYVRVDPHTNRVSERPVTSPLAGWVTPVGAGQVANFLHGTVMPVDEASLSAIGRLFSSLSSGVGDVAVGDGAVWVAGTTDSDTGQGGLWRIDARTHKVAQVASIRFARLVAVGPGSVWVVTGPLTEGPSLEPNPQTPPVVVRFDPASERIVGKPVSLPSDCSDPGELGPSGEGVWVVDCPGLIRIEPTPPRQSALPTVVEGTRTLETPPGVIIWTITASQSSEGPCITVDGRSVSGQSRGSLGGSCGRSGPAGLDWGEGGLRLAGQWFNVVYGQVSPPAPSVRVTLGDGTTISDTHLVHGLFIVVVRTAPTDHGHDFVLVEALDANGGLVASVRPPSLADERQRAKAAAHP